MDAGVTFTFEDRTAEDLLFGEVEALLDEYHKMPGLVQQCFMLLVAVGSNPT